MKQKKYIYKLLMATILVFAVQIVFASLTSSSTSGTTSSKKASVTSKYTLKNLSKYSNRLTSLNTLRLNAKLNAVELKNNGSYLQTTNNNTTFVYSYKLKVKVPKFKAPTPNNF